MQKNLVDETNIIDISALIKGLYIIRLTDNDWSVESKFIKE